MSTKNKAPGWNNQGWRDSTHEDSPAASDNLPQHVPFVFLLAGEGEEAPFIADSNSAKKMYGMDAFNMRSPYFTHQNLFAELFVAEQNKFIGKRLRTAGAETARIAIFIEVIDKDVTLYERNSDGSYKLDLDGAPVPTDSSAPGTLARWIVKIGEEISQPFGNLEVTPGILTSNVPNAKSTIYPIYEGEISNFGMYGNNIAVRMYGPTEKDAIPADMSFVGRNKAFEYRFQFLRRQTVTTTPKVLPTLMSEQYVTFAFKPDLYDASYNKDCDANVAVPQGWWDDSTESLLPPPARNQKFYQEHIDTVHAAIFEKEKNANPTVTDMYEINIMGAKCVEGNPYYAFEIAGAKENGLLLTSNSQFYFGGGADGDLSDEAFEKAVVDYLYAMDVSPDNITDGLRFPFTDIYETGFTTEAKTLFVDALANFKEVRINTCSQDVNARKNTASEDTSISIGLHQRFALHPESVLYQTDCCRGVVVAQAGKSISPELRGYKRLIPLLYQVAAWRCKYAGNPNGRLDEKAAYDDGRDGKRNRVTLLTDLNHTYLSDGAKDRMWSNGITFAQTAGIRSIYIPAVQSVYGNPDSPLNSDINVGINIDITKRARRVFTLLVGNGKLTDGQFIAESNRMMALECRSSNYDGRVQFKFDSFYTGKASWNTRVEAYYANNKYYNNFTLDNYRQEDFK